MLPTQIRVLERGWLSSNNILFLEGSADANGRWDEDALLPTPSGQHCDRSRHAATLRPGDEFELGNLVWQALPAP